VVSRQQTAVHTQDQKHPNKKLHERVAKRGLVYRSVFDGLLLSLRIHPTD